MTWIIRDSRSFFLVIPWQISFILDKTHFNWYLYSDRVDRLTYWTLYRIFISEVKASILNTSGNRKEKTINLDNSFDFEMKNNDDNSNDTIASEKFNSIKIIKSKIFNDQWTELKNWLFQLKLYFAFNTIKDDRKTFFIVSRISEKIFNWIEFNMKQFLHNDKNIDRIFNVFDRFKIVIRRIFNMINETVIFIKVIQHLLYKISTIDYVQ